MSAQIVATISEYRGVKAGLYQGVIETVEQKHGTLGVYTSGERLWRCGHEHRTQEVARKCADPSPEEGRAWPMKIRRASPTC